MIAATTDGKRILIRFPYDKRDVARVKTVPGARWAANQKEWRVPLTMDSCRFLRRVFGQDLKVMPMLAEWARAEVAREQKLELLRDSDGNAAAGSLLKVAEEAPDLFRAMSSRGYQLSGSAFLVAGKQVILGDDPGLGKTLQTLGALIESDAKAILVACRRTAVRSVWQRETLRWTPGIWTFVAQGSRSEREHAMKLFREFPVGNRQRKMLIINIEMIRAKRVEVCPQGLGEDCPAKEQGQCKHKYEAEYDWPFLFSQQWDAIVLDESHNLLASTKNFQSKSITQARYGAVQLRRCLKDDGLAVALSGTWVRSKLPKAWGTLNWLRPDVFSSYWRWCETHFGVEKGRYGNIVGSGLKAPKPLDQDAWDTMLRPYYLRRDKATAAPDLPPVMFAGTPIDPDDPDSPLFVQLDMGQRQAKAYRQMSELAEATLLDGRILANGVLAEITRLRQFADAYGRVSAVQEVAPVGPSNKLDWLLEFMEEREDSGRKVVVASSFTGMVKLAAITLEAAGFQVMTLTGETSDRDRAALVSRFADPNDEAQVVIINTQAGGESITLDAADEMVIIDQPWTSDAEEQLIARIHRVSRIHQVTVYRLASVGTVDTWIGAMNDEQRSALLAAEPRSRSKQLKEAA